MFVTSTYLYGNVYVYTYVYIFIFYLSIHHLPGFRLIICPFLYFFVCRPFSMYIHVLYTIVHVFVYVHCFPLCYQHFFSKYNSPLPLFHYSAIYFFVICYSVLNVFKYPYVRYIKILFYLHCIVSSLSTTVLDNIYYYSYVPIFNLW